MSVPYLGRATAWLRHWGFAAALALVFVIAVGIRLLLVLRTSGGLFGLGNYDDGVHFAAALGLVNGLLPYRDFLLLHPPGVVLAMAPFAALSWLIGEPDAMAAARLTWMVLGGINAVLCGLVLRPVGRAAALVGALFYALFVGAVYVEYTALLESPATAVMLLALVATRLLGSPAGIGRLHYLAAGAMLGFSPVMKIWGVVTVLVIVGALLLRRGRGPALLTLGGAVATSTVVCLPFFVAAPVQMWQMVVGAQLGRRRTAIALPDRLNDILGVRVWVGGQDVWDAATVVMLVVVLAALAICLARPELRTVGVLLAANGVLVIIAPMWFLHYAGLTAAPIALAIGGATGTAMTWALAATSRPWVSWSVGVAAVIGTLVLAIPLPRFNLGNPAYPSQTIGPALAPRPGCVATDFPMTLLQLDLLQRNLDRGCPFVVDIGGYSYYSADGTYSEVSRRKNKDFQVVILDYYRSANAVAPYRFSTQSGYSKATARTIDTWPVIVRSGRFVVREPQPAEHR